MFPTEMALMVLYAEEFLCSSVFVGFYRTPRYVRLLESVLRAIVNRSRVYPPLADLSAVFLVRRLCGGVEGLPAVILEGWPADHLMT